MELYERTYTGRLTEEHSFGVDPLSESFVLFEERENQFSQNFSVETIFKECVHGRHQQFHQAILFFINITSDLSL